MWYNVVSILKMSILKIGGERIVRIAVIGSRSIKDIELEGLLPPCEEIITGGAVGIDRIAEQYARHMRIHLTVITPDYAHYGRAAPLVRDR